MVVTTAPNGGRWAARIRLAVLVAVALLVAHTAIYAAEDGLGAAFAAALSRDGHDGWWLPVAVAIGTAGTLAAAVAAARLVGLELRARHGRRGRRGVPGIRSETGSIARRLIPIVLTLFGLQENLEQLAAHGRVLGVDAVIGPAHPLAVPVLVVVCLALSSLGALVRWRVATLRRRIANGSPRRPERRIASRRIDPAWRTVGALAPRGWMLDRLDAGRSPPIVLHP
jgi:hypothetical protein